MKLLVFITMLLFFATSCGNMKHNPDVGVQSTTEMDDKITVTVKENTTYTLVEDTTGALYPAFEEANATTLIFKYTEKGPEGTADGDYTETIHIMIPDLNNQGELNDEQLQEVAMTFGKFCFCRGQAGYRLVQKGRLKFTRENQVLHIDTSFEIPNIEQKVKQIKKSISL